MSTRSRIAIENQNGSVKSIYCHFDGYLSGVGRLLKEYYTTQPKVEALIELGNISALEMTPESTVAYARDRGEDLNFITFPNVEDLFDYGFESGIEYVYCLTKDGIWLVNRCGSSYVEILKETLEEEGL
jgi:hypothetical protein